MVEFVSYDGEFPNRCAGTLVLKIDGVKRVLGDYLHPCMISGGCVWFDEDFLDHVEYGPWEVDVPDDLKPYEDEINECVNKHVTPGCCGGCIIKMGENNV